MTIASIQYKFSYYKNLYCIENQAIMYAIDEKFKIGVRQRVYSEKRKI